MHVAVGGMLHESNTFTHETLPFVAFRTVSGHEVFESDRWMTDRATGGAIDELRAEGHDVIPTFFAKGLPGGTVEAEARKRIHSAIIDRISDTTIDAVYLDLHGSMCATDEGDPEGALLADVRECVGPAVPIVCSLDMHATVTSQMTDNVDGLTAYRTAPHTDVYETGERAARLLIQDVVEGDDTPVVERVRLPILLAGEQSETDSPPMNWLIDRLYEVERQEGVFDASYLLGFPWADSPHSGVFAVVVASDEGRASTVAADLASTFWEARQDFDFTTEAYPLAYALDAATAHEGQPVVISDSGDNPTAGAPEDLTIVLEAILDRPLPSTLVAVITDPQSRAACDAAGVGSETALELGRTGVATDAPPLSISGTVTANDTIDGVGCSAIDVRAGDGIVTVLITDDRVAVTDPKFPREIGIDPAAYDYVVVKSGYLSPAYQSLASRKMLALTPGTTDERLSRLSYESAPRPIYPIDDASWTRPD